MSSSSVVTLSLIPYQNDNDIRSFVESAYSDNINDKRQAVNKIKVWEARFVDAISTGYRKQNARLSYRNIAKQVDIPSHLISLRHDIAHSDLPPLSDLLEAVHYGKTWLRKNCFTEIFDEMSLFTDGAYSETLVLIAKETLHAYVDSKMDYVQNRTKKRREKFEGVIEEIEKALKMSGAKEIFADILIQCGKLLMLPIQLEKMNYDKGSSILLPLVVIKFWKPVFELCIENGLTMMLIKQFLSTIDPHSDSIINRQRVGWIFHIINKISTSSRAESILSIYNLNTIFNTLIRNIRPWFVEYLIDLVKLMGDDNLKQISHEKCQKLIEILNIYMIPYDDQRKDVQHIVTTDNNSNEYAIPRKQMYIRDMAMVDNYIIEDMAIPAGLMSTHENVTSAQYDLDYNHLTETRDCK
ncbi:unnamed protein product [Didymodactylos carnosus]|uniref:Uncharacterized protein n=1 Tax=Didymodactylos carnosus TaxID=1234261 RepID=A0A8S2DSF9_9BILA|nr:unnamed protein product [Didymodactylos carnosus]CAF3760108.1 unnamed protein product [Didymodactylos carnosus]